MGTISTRGVTHYATAEQFLSRLLPSVLLRALRVHYTFRDSLTVEVRKFLKEVDVLHLFRLCNPSHYAVLVVVDWCAETRS